MSIAGAVSRRRQPMTRAQAAWCLLIAATLTSAPAYAGSGQTSPMRRRCRTSRQTPFPRRPGRPSSRPSAGRRTVRRTPTPSARSRCCCRPGSSSTSPPSPTSVRRRWHPKTPTGGTSEDSPIPRGRCLPSRRGNSPARMTLAPDRDALVSLRLADARLAAGADNEAATLYQDLVAIPDHAASAWYGLGRLALRRDDMAAARDALQKAVALSPDFGGRALRPRTRAPPRRRRRCGGGLARAATAVPGVRPRARRPVAGSRGGAPRRCLCPAHPGHRRRLREHDGGHSRGIRLHEAALGRREVRGQAHVNLIELYRRAGDAERARQHYLAALDDAGLRGRRASAVRGRPAGAAADR